MSTTNPAGVERWYARAMLSMAARVWLATTIVALPCAARAQEERQAAPTAPPGDNPMHAGDDPSPGDEPPAHYVNLRLGGSTGNANGMPEICLEASPFGPLSAETCGTGTGTIHEGPGRELWHIRLKARLFEWDTGFGWIEPGLGAGFAEMQVGEDDLGFRFADTGPRALETAGPEASLFIRWTYPLAVGLEMVGDLYGGAGYFAHAPELARPQEAWQAFFGVGIGVGY